MTKFDRREAKIARLQGVLDDTELALQVIRNTLGIRDDFVPLGAALDLEPTIRTALARIDALRDAD